MKSISGPILEFDSLPSTQIIAAELLKKGEKPGVIFCHDQTNGKGRFNRTWISRADESLTASIIFHDYANHSQPWLIGMTLAIAVAATLRLQLQWPNDLTIQDRKIGGILTELLPDQHGNKIPVIGLGININQDKFPPEIADKAISLLAIRGHTSDPRTVLQCILDSIDSAPEPDSWESIESAWRLFDNTTGKPYKLATGEVSTAIGIGPEGQLITSIDGETHSVLAADAIFGSNT